MQSKIEIGDFPHSPGVYLMKDNVGRVIYVGKAIDLKKRVATYLNAQDDRYQVRFLMNRVVAIEYIVTDNEKEALLLENTLIKKHRPRYNIQLRDDKSYISLKLSIKDKFPRLYVTRNIKKDGAIYFGPYSSSTAARETGEFIQKYFRLRTCSDREFANRVRPCLQHQIHRCDAPCVGLIDQDHYRTIVEQVKLFLQGRREDLVKILEAEMQILADQEEFEKAAQYRDVIASIRTTLEKQNVARHNNWLDQDVMGLYREGEYMTFCVLMIREGKVWDSITFHLKGQGEDEDVMESFINQFYATDRFLPDEILLSHNIPSLDSVSDWLSEKRDKKVSVLIPERGDKVDLVQLAVRNAREGFEHRSKKAEEASTNLTQLQETLGLQNLPRRMECFDISNISGQYAVGSLVCFVEGVPYKDGYRKFKIKTVEGPNDFAMMREVLKRRLLRISAETSSRDGSPTAQELESGEGVMNHAPTSKWEKPDLLVIDGGKGQLNIVTAVMEELNITGIDIISLAKEHEGEDQDKVFLPGRKNPVLLGRHSNLLHLLMRIRDEAHRFAITYHRKLRAKNFLPSSSKGESGDKK